MALQVDLRKAAKIVKDVQSTDASGGVNLWVPASGKKFVITDIIASADTAMTLTFADGVTTIIEVYLAANGGFVSNFQTPIESTTANNNLTITASAAGNVSVTVTGYEI